MDISPVTNYEYLQGILEKLKVPMPYKWRVQSFSKSGNPQATCVAYIDSRDVMDRLDEVCVFGWQRSHTEIKGNIYCSIGVNMPDGTQLWRQDCGTESSTEKEKGESSDSFKRAAVNWGVGRFLYDLEIKRLPANELKTGSNFPYVVDDKGKKVWDITKHINNTIKKSGNAEANEQADELWNNALNAIKTATDMDSLKKHFTAAYALCSSPAEQQAVTLAKDNRKKELS
jgi:hypothetical protein